MKYRICSNDQETRICPEHEAKTLYEGGSWTSMGVLCNSVEEVIEKEGNPEKPCVECGRIFSTNYIPEVKVKLIKQNVCHCCNFWREKVEIKDLPSVVRINGNHHQIAAEDSTYPYRGCGGTRFTIRFNDGREVTTTNLWNQGTIPAHFRDRLPDNAQFVTR